VNIGQHGDIVDLTHHALDPQPAENIAAARINDRKTKAGFRAALGELGFERQSAERLVAVGPELTDDRAVGIPGTPYLTRAGFPTRPGIGGSSAVRLPAGGR